MLTLAFFVRPASAQKILLKTGQSIETRGVRRSGDMVMAKIQIGSSAGEVGYQTSAVARIEFPRPPQLKATAALLSRGEPRKALADIGPVVKYYEPFRDIPGNWWAQTALLEVSALGGMQLDKEAEALGNEIRRNVTDPEMVRAVRLQLVPGLIRRESYHESIQLCDDVIRRSSESSVLAEAWVRKGDAWIAQRQWENALLSYLHVPIFYRDEQLWMPAALFGSAHALRALADPVEARKRLAQLVTEFPKSSQAEIARTELKKRPK